MEKFSLTADELELVSNDFFVSGFFSEYLPPCFSLDSDFNYLAASPSKTSDNTAPLFFTMSRFAEKGQRRTIAIPEFTSYLRVVNYMRENNIIEKLIELSQSDHSFSPLLQSDASITRHEQSYSKICITEETDGHQFGSTYVPNMIKKICLSKGARGILHLDIANFYASIYTHFLPCIALGYDEANKQYLLSKVNKNDSSISKDYNTFAELDNYVRTLNCNRTNGLLQGPLISRFLSEALLSRIDIELEELGIRFIRYVDDYEVFIYNEAEIERVQNCFSRVLNKYALYLNSDKTKYTPFPYYLYENMENLLPDNNAEYAAEQLSVFFDKFFVLEREGTKGAIRFLVKSIKTRITNKNNALFASRLISILVNDPRSLVKACERLIDSKEYIKLSDEDKEMLDGLITTQINSNNHLETIWLLYLRMRLFDTNLSLEVIEQIISSDNDLAKILIMEECANYTFNDKIKECVSQSCSWLLGYQLFLHDYIDDDRFRELCGINKNIGYYRQLKARKYSFYTSKLA